MRARTCRFRFLNLACKLFLIVACVLLQERSTQNAFADEATASPVVYRFGVVPQLEQRKLFNTWVPILEMLEAETGLKFELVGSEQIPAFERKFLAGDFDFSYMNPYHVVIASETQGYIPLVRDGGRQLQGIIVVKSDSPITSLTALAGTEVAFPSANALGASLLPRAELFREHGIQLTPRYVKTHSSVYLHVIQGLVSAGGGVESTLKQQKPEIQASLRILYRTQTLNTHPIVAHHRVPPEHIQRVQSAFIAMAKRSIGKKLLAKIPMRKVVKTSINDYKAIKQLQLDKINSPGAVK